MGGFKEFITEAIEPIATLKNKLETTYKNRDVYVHFSGWNPSGCSSTPTIPFLTTNKRTPTHMDPAGVYAFPSNYLLSSEKIPTHFLRLPYVYILEPTSSAKILKLSSLTKESSLELLDEMGIPRDYYDYTSLASLPVKFINAIGDYTARQSIKLRRKSCIFKNIFKNNLLRKTKYNVILDDGAGAFHVGEPYQAVFLDPKAYKVIDYISINKSREAINWLKGVLDLPVKSIEKLVKYSIPVIELTFDNGFTVEVGIESGAILYAVYDEDGALIYRRVYLEDLSPNELKKAEDRLRKDAASFSEEDYKDRMDRYKAHNDAKAEKVLKFSKTFGLSLKHSKLDKFNRSEGRIIRFVKEYRKKYNKDFKGKFEIDFNDEELAIAFIIKNLAGISRLEIRHTIDDDTFSNTGSIREAFNNALSRAESYIDDLTVLNYENHPHHDGGGVSIYGIFSNYNSVKTIREFLKIVKYKTLKLK